LTKREAAARVKIVLGETVRTRRKRLGLSQEELAHIADVHPTYLSAIERGERNPALENLYAIACALGVPLAELFRFREKRTIQ
jgi:XRE family transcriptional regulator, regulator of sulfur utilization